MPKVVFEGKEYVIGSGSLLDELALHGVRLPSGCRAGVCQGCRVEVSAGEIPPGTQDGLDLASIDAGQVLACRCRPLSDIAIARLGSADRKYSVKVISIDRLSDRVCAIRFERPEAFCGHAGQFIRLSAPDGAARCYSLASVPGLDDHLCIHVEHRPQGRVSGWLCQRVRPGDQLEISAPQGNCRYDQAVKDQPMLLIGTGTGIAPLFAMVREAIACGHGGRIALYHGVRTEADSYLKEDLSRLARHEPRIDVHLCLSGAEVATGYRAGRASDVALSDIDDLSGWRVYLCGSAGMVESTRVKAFLAGASMSCIHADPFVMQQ